MSALQNEMITSTAPQDGRLVVELVEAAVPEPNPNDVVIETVPEAEPGAGEVPARQRATTTVRAAREPSRRCDRSGRGETRSRGAARRGGEDADVRGGDGAGGNYGSVRAEEEVRRQGSIKQNGGSAKALPPFFIA